MNRRLAAVLTLVAATCLTTSCSILSSEPGTLDTNNGPTFTGPPGSGKSPEQQAGEGALAKISEYYTVLARLNSDPTAPLFELDTVAAGRFLDRTKKEITTSRNGNPTPPNDLKVLKSVITKHDIPIDENGAPTAGTATLQMDVCISKPVDKLELGKPILTNTAWPDPAGWRVTADYTQPGTPCSAGSF